MEYSFIKVIFLSFPAVTAASSSSSFLRGEPVTQPFDVLTIPLSQSIIDVRASIPDFNCFAAAWNGENAEETCQQSKATDGSPCLWCSAHEDVMGACLSSSEADIADGHFGLNCLRNRSTFNNLENTPLHEFKPMHMISNEKNWKDNVPSSVLDFNCFKAAWVATDAESVCGQSKASDGTDCIWCQTKGDSMGACLSDQQSQLSNGKFGLHCPDVREAPTNKRAEASVE